MVISKVGKRKQQKANPPVVKETRPSIEIPKRPKVQAQRKFAQIYSAGHSSVLTPSSSPIANASSSTQNGAGKSDSNEPSRELLPNRRPNTEDFLTFLCFRGTPVLPPHLDFFNTNKTTTETKIDTKQKPSGSGINTADLHKVQNVKKEEEKPTKVVKEKQKIEPEKESEEEKVKEENKSPTFIPFAVRKRADTIACGTRGQAVQALKKKYQEQRIAKNNVKCNKNRTLPTNAKTTNAMQKIKGNEKSARHENNASDNNAAAPAAAGSGKVKRKLRGNGNANDSENNDDSTIVTKALKTAKDSKIRSRTNSNANALDTDKNGNAKVTTRAQRSLGPPTNKPKQTENSPVDESNTRYTRHKSYSLPNKRLSKPAYTDTEEKSSVKDVKKANAGRNSVASKSLNTVETDFTSDDDRPLAGNDKKKRKSEPTKRVEKPILQRKRMSNRGHDNSVDRKSENSSKNSEPAAKRKSTAKQKETMVTEKKSAPRTRRSGAGVDSQKSEIDSQEDIDKDQKKSRKKRRNEFTDLSQTDQSENETRTGRPMRKTKEAAAIYMELIGQKLNWSDFDDDNSMDSFPELPNVRKTEQMENELRANLSREKRESTATPKKTKVKKEEKNSFLGETSADTKVRQREETTDKVTKSTGKSALQKNDDKSKYSATVPKKNTKLEKSFSDSDDEPLATKLKKTTKSPRKNKKVVEVEATSILVKEEKIIPKPKTEEVKKDIVTPIKSDDSKLATDDEDTRPPRAKQSTPKSIDLNDSEFKMPAESVTQLLSPPINVSPIKQPHRDSFGSKMKMPTTSKESIQSSPSAKNSTQSISAILADLNSSKEDGKIFGIASVTLAQSSGPNDTKCTLGKCGSIHKPPLGPVVPTESYLSEHLSSRERRKAKVNMTHEQIEKWLLECSMTEKIIEPDNLDDEIDLSKPLKPVDYLTTPSPSLKERENIKDDSTSTTIPRVQKTIVSAVPATKVIETKVFQPIITKKIQSDPIKIEVNKEIEKPAPELKLSDKLKKENGEQNIKPASKESPQTKQSPSANSNVSKSLPITPPDKKPIYNRRTPVYNAKKPEVNTSKNSSGSAAKTFGAFSPENEASVYSFDKEEDTRPAVPFRRHGRRGSTDEHEKSSTKKEEISEKPQPKKPQISTTLSPNEKSKTEVGTKSGTNNTTEKCNKKSDAINQEKNKPTDEEGKDSDSEGHTFYIPLQCMGTLTDGSSDQLIQGVAVKLGTEGPEGPNQKVIMHAKLVTKSQMGSNTTPIPEGIANVHEIVKNLIANKEAGLKSMQIGAILPKPTTNETEQASTSAANQNGQTKIEISKPNVPTPTTSKGKANKRTKVECTIQSCNNTVFPRHDDPAQMVEAPVFKPTEKEFQDPIDFINRIAPIAARFGLCRIIPPSNFKPECKISDDMRFTAYNQYVHKMLHRWGPSVKELNAIKKYLATQSITLTQPPLIGGMEVDLPRLYHTVQECGGLRDVIEKKKWARVAEEMCIPKAAQDRVTKLDDIYCKYLLPYDTLSPSERQKLFDGVEADWAKSEAKARRNADRSGSSEGNSNENSEQDEQDEDEEDEDEEELGDMECIVKGKSMALSAFFRVARNTMALWFKNSEPISSEIESEYWRHVAVRDSHVCVHSGSIDSSGWGYGFPAPGPKTKNSTCSKHPWNLKVFTNNSNSILRSIGPVTGVTVPTLHVGMLFSACCWYRDPHGLPWIEYLHTGGSKIWYSVPNEQSANFRTAFSSLVPTHCQNKNIWLPCDTAMVPPHMLTDRGVSLCRTEQEPGQFVVVFPRAYTSNLCTGYSISESVYFAPMSWLKTAKDDFKDIHDSAEPAMFSLEQLLFSVALDARTNIETLETVLPMIIEVFDREKNERDQIKSAGVNRTEKFTTKSKKPQTEENECDICRANLYISWIRNEDENIYCLQHAVKYLKKERIQAKQCKLFYKYNISEMEEIINKTKEKLSQHQKKKSA